MCFNNYLTCWWPFRVKTCFSK